MSTPVILQGTTQKLRINTTLPDVTGWQFRAQIRSVTGALLAEWTPQQVEAQPYVLFLPLDPEVTAAWSWTTADLGLEATSPTGQVTRVTQGPVQLSREVVR